VKTDAPRSTSGRHALIDAADSVLVLVDVQEKFLERVEAERQAGFLERIAFLAQAARWLEIPILATVERPEDWGGLHPALARVLPDTAPTRKEVFALADDEAVWALLRAVERGTVVLSGLETDVCVAQSALSLLAKGYQVVAVGDAVASPGEPHEYGLSRMRAAGVLVLSAKQLFYEWMRTVPTSRRFRAEHPDLGVPPGMTL
jgi:nicotinamidase-related amidase